MFQWVYIILCELKYIKHWQWHSILKIISLFLSKIEYKCFYQWDNWILVSTSGYGQGFAFFFFFQFCMKVRLHEKWYKNNSAVLVGRKHFLFQKSIGKEWSYFSPEANHHYRAEECSSGELQWHILPSATVQG